VARHSDKQKTKLKLPQIRKGHVPQISTPSFPLVSRTSETIKVTGNCIRVANERVPTKPTLSRMVRKLLPLQLPSFGSGNGSQRSKEKAPDPGEPIQNTLISVQGCAFGDV
jgi:hypothetical protein